MDLTADAYGHKGHNSDSAAFPKASYRPDFPAQSEDSYVKPTCCMIAYAHNHLADSNSPKI